MSRSGRIRKDHRAGATQSARRALAPTRGQTPDGPCAVSRSTPYVEGAYRRPRRKCCGEADPSQFDPTRTLNRCPARYPGSCSVWYHRGGAPAANEFRVAWLMHRYWCLIGGRDDRSFRSAFCAPKHHRLGFDEFGVGWYAQIYHCRYCGRQGMRIWPLA
jgi:hypothetical protein